MCVAKWNRSIPKWVKEFQYNGSLSWSQIVVSSCLPPPYLGLNLCPTADMFCPGFTWISGRPLCSVPLPLWVSSAGFERRAEYLSTKQVIHCWAEIAIYCWYSNKELRQIKRLIWVALWCGQVRGLIKKKKKKERGTVGIKKLKGQHISEAHLAFLACFERLISPIASRLVST